MEPMSYLQHAAWRGSRQKRLIQAWKIGSVIDTNLGMKNYKSALLNVCVEEMIVGGNPDDDFRSQWMPL